MAATLKFKMATAFVFFSIVWMQGRLIRIKISNKLAVQARDIQNSRRPRHRICKSCKAPIHSGRHKCNRNVHHRAAQWGIPFPSSEKSDIKTMLQDTSRLDLKCMYICNKVFASLAEHKIKLFYDAMRSVKSMPQQSIYIINLPSILSIIRLVGHYVIRIRHQLR